MKSDEVAVEEEAERIIAERRRSFYRTDPLNPGFLSLPMQDRVSDAFDELDEAELRLWKARRNADGREGDVPGEGAPELELERAELAHRLATNRVARVRLAATVLLAKSVPDVSELAAALMVLPDVEELTAALFNLSDIGELAEAIRELRNG